jgi:hypothetical protein
MLQMSRILRIKIARQHHLAAELVRRLARRENRPGRAPRRHRRGPGLAGSPAIIRATASAAVRVMCREVDQQPSYGPQLDSPPAAIALLNTWFCSATLAFPKSPGLPP